MEYIYTEMLNKNQSDQVFKLICNADKEFIPHLSCRNSTTQKELLKNVDEENLPYGYFDSIKEQSAILAVEDDRVIGFMSFIVEHTLEIEGNRINTLYLSTIIVEKENRGKGISYGMYKFLIEKYKDKNIITRTWSTNTGHLKLLKKLGFKLLKCIEDDRGKGIDTVYYGRLVYAK